MRQKADLYDLNVLQNEVHRRAQDAGLTAVFSDKLKEPKYDYASKRIGVPTLKLPYSTEDLAYLRGSLIHEIGRSNRQEVVNRIASSKIKMDSPFGTILSIVEDGAMQREIAATWLGDAASLGEGHQIHVTRQVNNLAELRGEAMPEEHAKTNGVYALGERYRKWDKWSAQARGRLDIEMPPEMRTVTDELDSKGFGHKMARAQSVEQVFSVAKELYKHLFPDDDKDPEAGDSSQNSQGEADANGTAKKGKEGQDGEGGAGGKKGDGDPTASMTKWQMLVHQTQPGGTPNSKAKIDYSDWTYTNPRSLGGLLLPVKIHTPSTPGCPAPKAPSFIGALRTLLQSYSRNKFQFGLTSGRLDQRKLAKLAMPIVPGSDSWRKVFKRRIPGKKINTAVQILVDGSGSMSGRKNEVAADAADVLVQAFAGPLRIKVAVHGFDASGVNRIWKIKEFNENVTPGQIASRARGLGFSGNADGDAVIWGLGNIIKRPENRKIMIVLSDGMPSDGTRVVDPGSMLKYAIDSARGRGVEVFGIGIEDRSVQHFYGTQCKVINNVNELPSAIIETLRSKL